MNSRDRATRACLASGHESALFLRAQTHATTFELADGAMRCGIDRAAAIELPDRRHVAAARVGQRLCEPGAIVLGAEGAILEHSAQPAGASRSRCKARF